MRKWHIASATLLSLSAAALLGSRFMAGTGDLEAATQQPAQEPSKFAKSLVVQHQVPRLVSTESYHPGLLPP